MKLVLLFVSILVSGCVTVGQGGLSQERMGAAIAAINANNFTQLKDALGDATFVDGPLATQDAWSKRQGSNLLNVVFKSAKAGNCGETNTKIAELLLEKKGVPDQAAFPIGAINDDIPVGIMKIPCPDLIPLFVDNDSWYVRLAEEYPKFLKTMFPDFSGIRSVPEKRVKDLMTMTTQILEKTTLQCNGDKFSRACVAMAKMKSSVKSLGEMIAAGEAQENFHRSAGGIAAKYCENHSEMVRSAKNYHNEKAVVELTGVVNTQVIYNSGKNVLELGRAQNVLAENFKIVAGRDIDVSVDCKTGH